MPAVDDKGRRIQPKRSKRRTLNRPTPDQADRNRARKIAGPPVPSKESRRNAKARAELRRIAEQQVRVRGRGGLEEVDTEIPDREFERRADRQPGRGRVVEIEKRRKQNREDLRKAQRAARVLFNRRASDAAQTRARKRLNKLGLVSGDSVNPPDAGSRHRVIEKQIMPGALRHSFEVDEEGRQRRLYMSPEGGFTQRRNPRLEKFLATIVDRATDTMGAGPVTRGASQAGLLPKSVTASLDKAAERGLIAGGKGVFEALIRPGEASVTGLGKGLRELGVIKDDRVTDVGHEIGKARNPLEILVKGADDRHAVTGADILEGVTGSKSARTGGIFVDLATDPLMWTGIGALPKASATRAAALTARLKAAGVQVDGLNITRMAERARETGDAEPLLAELQALAKESNVSTRALGRTKAERAAKREQRTEQARARTEDTQQIFQDIQAGKAGAQRSLPESRPKGTRDEGLDELADRIASEQGPEQLAKTRESADVAIRALRRRLKADPKNTDLQNQMAQWRLVREGTRRAISGYRATTTKGADRSLYVPDVAGQEALKSAARLTKSQDLRPGFRIRLLNPLGQEKASIPVPLPKKLADFRVLPVGTKKGRKQLARTRLADRAHEEVVVHNAAVREIDDQLDVIQRQLENTKMTDPRFDELEDVGHRLILTRDELKKSLERRLIKAQDKEVEKGKVTLTQSIDEAFERGNRRRMNRVVAPMADEFGRTTQMRFYQDVLKGIEDHLGNLNNPRLVASLEKIQLHRFARSDTGSQSALKAAGVKLTAKERAVMRELDRVDAQMAKFGRATGTLGKQLEDYGGPRIWNPEGTSVDQIVQNINSRLGASSFFARHRSQPAVSDLADPERLANTIARLSDREMTPEQARLFADEWHQTAMIRNASELMMRQEQRAGDTLNLDQLPPTFQRAAHLGEVMTPRGSESSVPLFNLDREQGLGGIAKLNRSEASRRGYGLPETDPLDITPADAIKSIDADLARIAQIRRTTKSGTQYDKDLRVWSRRLRVQKAALERERVVEQGADEAGMLDFDVGEALGRSIMDDAGDEFEAALDEALSKAIEDGDWAMVERITQDYNAWKRAKSRMEEDADFDRAQLEEFGPDLPSRGASMARDIDKLLEQSGGNPFDDVVGDVTSRLPDFRESNFFPILDMRNSYFYRTRSEGVNVAFRSRWKGIDAAEGRSVEEAEALYRAPDGSEGRVADLEQWEVPDERADVISTEDAPFARAEGFIDQPAAEPHVFWYDRRLDRVFDADELKTSKPALVPNSDRSLFWDLNTGRQYGWPHRISAAIGERIDDVIQPKNASGAMSHQRVWPVEVIHAADMEAMRAGEYDIVFKTGMEKGLGKVLSLLRYGVTSPWPAYHVRNAVSDLLKSMQADSGVMFHPVANAKLTALAFRQGRAGKINIKGLGEMESEDFLLMADAFGLRSGHHVAEVSRIAETGEFPVRGRVSRTARAMGPSGTVGSKIVDFGTRREDVTRFITFAQRMRANGGDAADAMLYMIRHHFNYNDLTIDEKRIVRNVFLFYTWYRKNIPLQLTEIVRRPGFFSGVAHTYEALESGETPINQNYSKLHPFFPDLSGEMPRRGAIPDYLQDRLSSVGVSWNGHAAMFGFGAPWADLALLKASPEGLRDWAAMMNPIITTGLQATFQKELLTGRDFKEMESGGPANAVDAIARALGQDGLMTDDKGRPVLPWAVALALRNTVPGLGRLFGTFETPSTQRDPGRLQEFGKKGAFLHGVNVYVSPGAGTTREELAITNRVKGRAQERAELLKRISNLPEKERTRRTAEFDRETLIWAKNRGIPREYLSRVKATGFYQGKTRVPGGTGLSEGGSLPNLGGGRGLGG